MTTAFGSLPAVSQGRTVQLNITGAQAWAVAQWAVANAKDLSVTQVDVAGASWNRQDHKGWQDSAAASGSVTITVSAPKT
jgi:hypothetical protein